MSSDTFDRNTLPHGWVQEWDSNQNHPFWVDTKANPPRAIWVHPYEDEQFLSEHPEVRAKVRPDAGLSPPPAYEDDRRHSFAGASASGSGGGKPENDRRSSISLPDGKGVDQQRKRGFFGKMKDKAIGTKEEREERHRKQIQLEEQQRQLREKMRQQRMQELQQRYTRTGYPGAAGRPMYGAPMGNPYSMSNTLGGGYGGGYGGGFGGGFGGRSRMGGGGLAMPLLGGLAGGLLLGDLMDGGFGGGGFDGGGGGWDQGGFGGGF